MSGDSKENSHPARKVDQEELKQVLAEKRGEVPAVTKSVIATEFPDVTPQAVKDNLDALAENEEICRFNDGNILLYWYPREDDSPGDVPYSEVLDDSVDYGEIEPNKVPEDLAEEIAAERLPYYRSRSFWTVLAGFAQLGIMISFGVIILAIGEIVSSSLGLTEPTASLLLRVGFYAALISTGLYTLSVTLDGLSSWGYVTKDPVPNMRNLFS